MIVVFVILETYPKLKAKAFSATKEKTQKLSKNKAYCSYVKFQLLSTQVMMKIRKKSDKNLPTIIRKLEL